VRVSIGGDLDPVGLLFPLVYWDVFAMVWLALTWLALRRRTPAAVQTWARDIAARRSRWKDVILGREVGVGFPLLAALYGFTAGVWALPQAADLEPTRTGLLTVVSVAAVLISWLVVHVSFGLYYASQYYIPDPPGGLDFPGGQPPSFSDFGYFSGSIATTFGTSDVIVMNTRFRRVVLGHAVLAFVFNTGILGLTLSVLVR
jgi:uncharacterized membrane protein